MTTSTSQMVKNNNSHAAKWCKIVLSALVPLVLGVFTIVFSVQQQSLSKKQQELDRWTQLDTQQQTVFNAYINDISNLLLRYSDANRTRDKNILLYVKTKTLTALRHLNTERKKYILLFLYESGFLRDSNLNLAGANFDDIQLIGPYKLDRLYLPNVFWKNALFTQCNLNSAVFDQSHMINARFINSTIEKAKFRDAIVDNVHFIRTSVLEADFTGASLIQADFLQADVVQNISFINADLFNARFTENQFQGKRISNAPHDFHHARLPNGSFGPVDSHKNLIRNGDAEMRCPSNNTKEWRIYQISNDLAAVKVNSTGMGECMFRLTNKSERVFQFIDLHNYSRLINMNKAMYSSSAFIGCNESNNATYVEVSIHASDGNLMEKQIYLNRLENETDDNSIMYLYNIEGHRLPEYTPQVRISFGVRSTLMTGIWCYFDNLTFTIQEYKQ